MLSLEVLRSLGDGALLRKTNVPSVQVIQKASSAELDDSVIFCVFVLLKFKAFSGVSRS
jgi:hypothetical protein